MINKVHNYIRKHHMLEVGDQIVIGLSGGADSVCLLSLLTQLRETWHLNLVAVHIHHGLREGDADLDAQFSEALCKQLEVTYQVRYVDVLGYVSQYRVSEEEAGRILRYQVFEEVRRYYHFNKIAVAHHQDDFAETVLFNLFRGAGLDGLSGIPAKRDNIIRPLLSCTRQEIEDYLRVNDLSFRNDHTNDTLAYTRNKIRHNILSYAKAEVNERAVEHIFNSAAIVYESKCFIDELTALALSRCTTYQEKLIIYLEQFDKEHLVIQKNIIRKALHLVSGHKKDFDANHIEQVLSLRNKAVGKYIQLPHNIFSTKNYETLEISLESVKLKTDVPFFVELSIPDEVYLSPLGKILKIRIFDYDKSFNIPKNDYTKWFDYDTIKGALQIRTRQTGDYLLLKDVQGRKKLKTYFIDNKIPKEERDKILLLAVGQEIIWVIGERISEKNKVTNSTRRILSVEII